MGVIFKQADEGLYNFQKAQFLLLITTKLTFV